MSNSLMLDITENASKKAKQLLLESNLKPIGIRIGILEGGCSGLSYNVELTGEVKNGDEIVKIQGVTFIIDPAATLFLIGLQLNGKKINLNLDLSSRIQMKLPVVDVVNLFLFRLNFFR